MTSQITWSEHVNKEGFLKEEEEAEGHVQLQICSLILA